MRQSVGHKYEKNVNYTKESPIPIAIFFDIRYNNSNRIFVLKADFDFI